MIEVYFNHTTVTRSITEVYLYLSSVNFDKGIKHAIRSFISSRKTLNSSFTSVKKFPGLFQEFLRFFPGLEYYLIIFLVF